MLTLPAQGAALILRAPDRRAILPLRSRSGSLFLYGTAVVVGRDTLVTAQHVLTDSAEILLTDAPAPVRPACRTQYAGLAVVHAALPPETPRYVLTFRMPAVGETVTVAGYPLRSWQVRTGRITRMVRSANLSGRVVTVPMVAIEPAMDYGASGSPVLDHRGAVVAIAVASNVKENYTVALPAATGLRACRAALP